MKIPDNPIPETTTLDWIVDNRYINHKASLSIYNLIGQHKVLFEKTKGHRSTANILLGVAFSLWRSVFLVNIKQEKQSLLEDTERFLEELIESNTITYAVDRNRRDWSFRYYMSNASYRLSTLSSKLAKQGYPFDLPVAERNKSPQKEWTDAQGSLEAAITSFKDLLEAEAARKAFGQVKKTNTKPRRKLPRRFNVKFAGEED